MQKVLREMTAKHNAEINEESKRKEFSVEEIGNVIRWGRNTNQRREGGLHANAQNGKARNVCM